MSVVSSDSLFHFMNKFDYLENALDGKLYPRYYKENLKPFFKEPIYIGMKCFCDIPLSLVKKHSTTYGEYAVGLNKKWAIDNSINPVTYYNTKSSYIRSLRSAYNENIKMINKYSNSNNNYEDFEGLAEVKRMMQESFLNFKPISGKMWRSDKWIKSRYFYNEREWRYITKIDFMLLHQGKGILRKFLMENDVFNKDVEIYNKSIMQYDSIEFKPSDINFIILKSNKEITRIAEKIDTLSILDSEKTILKTKIIKYSDITKNM